MNFVKQTTMFLASSLILSTALATASLKVGDVIESKITFLEAGESGVYTSIDTIAEYKEDTKEFKVVSVMTDSQDTVINDEYWFPESSLKTQEEITDILATCIENGGTEEMFQLNGTETKSCKTKPEDYSGYISTVWYGDVPGGVIKSKLENTAENYNYDVELTGFKR